MFAVFALVGYHAYTERKTFLATSVSGEPLREAAQWLERDSAFWERRLERLAEYREAAPRGKRRRRTR